MIILYIHWNYSLFLLICSLPNDIIILPIFTVDKERQEVISDGYIKRGGVGYDAKSFIQRLCGESFL